jgi:hypothetical protein
MTYFQQLWDPPPSNRMPSRLESEYPNTKVPMAELTAAYPQDVESASLLCPRAAFSILLVC